MMKKVPFSNSEISYPSFYWDILRDSFSGVAVTILEFLGEKKKNPGVVTASAPLVKLRSVWIMHISLECILEGKVCQAAANIFNK